MRIPLEVFAELPNALLVRRTLRTHPWNTTLNPPHGVSDHPAARDKAQSWFEVPEPTAPERQVPLVISDPGGSRPMSVATTEHRP